jgi:hypothetical protein
MSTTIHPESYLYKIELLWQAPRLLHLDRRLWRNLQANRYISQLHLQPRLTSDNLTTLRLSQHRSTLSQVILLLLPQRVTSIRTLYLLPIRQLQNFAALPRHHHQSQKHSPRVLNTPRLCMSLRHNRTAIYHYTKGTGSKSLKRPRMLWIGGKAALGAKWVSFQVRTRTQGPDASLTLLNSDPGNYVQLI